MGSADDRGPARPRSAQASQHSDVATLFVLGSVVNPALMRVSSNTPEYKVDWRR